MALEPIKVMYQGFPAVDWSFRRSLGTRADRFHITWPGHLNISLVETEGTLAAEWVTRLTEKKAKEKDRIVLLQNGPMAFMDSHGGKAVIENVYVDDRAMDADRIYKLGESHQTKTTRVTLTDVRWLWEERGFVSGNYNMVATDERVPYLRLGRDWFDKRTILRSSKNNYRCYTLKELVEYCISQLPKSDYAKGFALRWGHGFALAQAPSTRNDAAAEDSLAVKTALKGPVAAALEVAMAADKIENPATIFPVNIRWGGATNAASALQKLLDDHNYVLALSNRNELSIHRRGQGIDYVREYAKDISNRNPGIAYQKLPLAYCVTGKRKRSEMVFADWDKVLTDDNGVVQKYDEVIKGWGITDEYVRQQVFLVDAQSQFANHETELGTKGNTTLIDDSERKAIFERRKQTLRNEAYKYFQVTEWYRDFLPLMPCLPVNKPLSKPGTPPGEYVIEGMFFVPQDSKNPNKGHQKIIALRLNKDYIQAVEGDKGRIKLKLPCGIVLPKADYCIQKQHATETQEHLKLRQQKSDLKAKIRSARADCDMARDLQRAYIDEQVDLTHQYAKLIATIDAHISLYPGSSQSLSLLHYTMPDAYLRIENAVDALITRELKTFKRYADKYYKALYTAQMALKELQADITTHQAEQDTFVLNPTLKASYSHNFGFATDYYRFIYAPAGAEHAPLASIVDERIQYYQALPMAGQESSNRGQCDQLALKKVRDALRKREQFEVPVDQVTLQGFHDLECDGMLTQIELSIENDYPVTRFNVNLKKADIYASEMSKKASTKDRDDLTTYLPEIWAY